MANNRVATLEVVTSRTMLTIHRLVIWLIAGYAALFLSCAVIFLMDHSKRNTLLAIAMFGLIGLIAAVASSIKLAVLHFQMINAFSRTDLSRITKIRADNRLCACWCRVMRDRRSTVEVFLHQQEITALAKAVEHFGKHKIVVVHDSN